MLPTAPNCAAALALKSRLWIPPVRPLVAGTVGSLVDATDIVMVVLPCELQMQSTQEGFN